MGPRSFERGKMFRWTLRADLSCDFNGAAFV